MIPCQSCNHENPVSARYCHSCGTKLDRSKKRVLAAVIADRHEDGSFRWMARGHSMLLVGGFLLLCALVLRYIVIPDMPSADVPMMECEKK